MGTNRRRGHRPPSSRRLLIGFLAFAALTAVGVFLVVTVLLVRVRSGVERDVDTALRDEVNTQLSQSAAQQADIVQAELNSITSAADFLREATQGAYAAKVPASPDEVARYHMASTGSYGTTGPDDGGASMIYSSLADIGAQEKAKASYLAAIDPAMKAILGANHLVAQAYLNTNDAMTRIYPPIPFEAIDGAVHPNTYNFYYLADAVHDPDRTGVWTNAYTDPAGQGWIVSAIAPVYTADVLEGVVGVDVTLESLAGELLAKNQPKDGFSILVDTDGVIIAMPPAGEELFGLKELTSADYSDFIYQDTFKPADFNVRVRSDTAELAAAVGAAPTGVAPVTVNGSDVVAAWHTLENPEWQVVTFVPAATVTRLHQPGERLKQATVVTLWILLGSFVVLGLMLMLRARRLTLAFTRPLEAIDEATERIAAGDFEPELPDAPVLEIQRTGEQLLAMGRSLQAAQQRMLDDAELLRGSEQRYRAIFDNVSTPVVTVGPDDVVLEANEAAIDSFGEELRGANLAELFPVGRWREPGRRTVEVVGPRGVTRWLDLGVSRVGEGEQALTTITVRDITAESQARALLENAKTTAERTARLKDEFLASMSHEIRTPLNGVIGVLSLLADRDLPVGAREELAVARRSADDLLVLVNDVLDFAKIDAGQVSVDRVDVRLADVLEGVRQLYAPFAAEQFDTLEMHLDDDVPEWVVIDPARVRQVLVNLISNALKFTEHGRVDITARLANGETVADAADGSGRFMVRFEVADTGVGITPEVQPRLFTRFSQGDPLAARKFPGTGLGLAIVRRLAELMGGEVGLHSSPGEGSTFWFTVLAEVGQPVEHSRPTVGAPVDGTLGALRVLVAEDNEVNRFLIVAILERLGHDVVAVVNGREAVEAAQREHFDLVLMDVQMPVANGIDATHAIRALPGPIATVPILAVTANVLPEQRDVYREVGFSGMVPKPLTLEQVEAAIAAVIHREPSLEPAVKGDPEAQDTYGPDRFDAELIEQYRSVIGEAGARQMVDLFLQTLGERRTEMAAGVGADDLAEIRRVGHAMKGMSAAVGAKRLAAVGGRLQHSEMADVPGLIAELDAESAAAVAGVAAAWGLDG